MADTSRPSRSWSGYEDYRRVTQWMLRRSPAQQGGRLAFGWPWRTGLLWHHRDERFTAETSRTSWTTSSMTRMWALGFRLDPCVVWSLQKSLFCSGGRQADPDDSNNGHDNNPKKQVTDGLQPALFNTKFNNDALVHNSSTLCWSEERLYKNIITSTKSATVGKIIGLLHKRRERSKHGATVVEGAKLVKDLLRDLRTRSLVQQVVITEDAWNHDPEILQLVVAAFDMMQQQQERPVVQMATAAVLNACTDTVTNQGIVAVVQIPRYHYNDKQELVSTRSPFLLRQDDVSVADRTTAAAGSSSSHLILILDGVADPGNVGTLIRSAVATGVCTILLLPGSCDPWSPKVVRSAMGAHFLPDLHMMECADWRQCIKWLIGDMHCQAIYAATMLPSGDDTNNNAQGDYAGSSSSSDDDDATITLRQHNSSAMSKPYFEIDWTMTGGDHTIALVIGNEGRGLSPAVQRAVQKGLLGTVHIPMLPNTVESLNAAISGSIILFEVQRQQQMQQQAKQV